jgi:hypothetical protein
VTRPEDTRPEIATTDTLVLVPDPQVWGEFGVTSMTGWRWTNDPELGFPPPIKIRNRSYRSRRAIEEFKQRMLGEAIRRRAAASESP